MRFLAGSKSGASADRTDRVPLFKPSGKSGLSDFVYFVPFEKLDKKSKRHSEEFGKGVRNEWHCRPFVGAHLGLELRRLQDSCNFGRGARTNRCCLNSNKIS